MKTKFVTFFKTDFGIAILVSIGWQITLTALGWILSQDPITLSHTSHWDAGWYKHIIAHGYGLDGSPAAPAFYPLFPLTVSVLSTISFGLVSLDFTAFLINTAALAAIITALLKILRHFSITSSARFSTIAVFLCFPSAFFLHVFYSEALFIALALWAYWFSLKKKWWAVGVLLAFLTAARLPSLLFVALCGLEYLRSYGWDIRKALNPKILYFLLAPLGFIVYALYLLVTRGDFLAMFHAYSATNDWTYQVFNPNIFETLYVTLSKIITITIDSGPTYELFINYALPFACIVLILASSVYVLRTLRSEGVSLFIFGILSIILFTLNGNIVSVHRYALACIVIFIAASLYIRTAKRRTLIVLIAVCCLIAQLFIYSKFIHNIFAG